MFYCLNESSGLEENMAFLHFCMSTSVNYRDTYTSLGDRKSVLRQLGRLLPPDSAQDGLKTEIGLIMPHRNIPSGGCFH